MCKLCSDENIGNLTPLANADIPFGESYLELEIFFGRSEDGKAWIRVGLFSESETVKEIAWEASYCPACGRKLK